MKTINIEKLARQYCKEKVKIKKFSDEWQPLSIPEMVEFAKIVVKNLHKPHISDNKTLPKSKIKKKRKVTVCWNCYRPLQYHDNGKPYWHCKCGAEISTN